MLRNQKSDSSPLKVLFLMEDLCYGGTQTQTLELAARLDRSLFAPSMLTLTGPTDLDEKAKSASISLWHMGVSRKVEPLFFLKLGKWLDKIRPDILVPCTALPNIWGRIWGRLKKVPVIIGTCRGGGALARQHEKFLWRACDAIVCNSRSLMEDMALLGKVSDKLHYIPNGVDIERFKPIPRKYTPEYALITNVARLAKDKDHQTLLRAFAIVTASYPNVRLRLVGGGPEENRLKQFVASELPEAVAANIEFAGPSADPAKHYGETDIFVLSSIREAQPNAILEAMSSGVPVCATRVGGIPDLLEGNGLLSEPGDVQGLANNILTFIRAPRMAAYMAYTGRKKAETEYSFEAMVKSHQNLFLDLWQKRKDS